MGQKEIDSIETGVYSGGTKFVTFLLQVMCFKNSMWVMLQTKF